MIVSSTSPSVYLFKSFFTDVTMSPAWLEVIFSVRRLFLCLCSCTPPAYYSALSSAGVHFQEKCLPFVSHLINWIGWSEINFQLYKLSMGSGGLAKKHMLMVVVPSSNVCVCACVWHVLVCVCSAQRELVTTAGASLIPSPADVPSSLTNHPGLPSGTFQSPLHIRSTHVPCKRTQVFSLCIRGPLDEILWGCSEG